LAGNFCLTCLDRCVSTVDFPIPAGSEISITLWCRACYNSLSKPSAVYVCELSVLIYLRSVSKLPCDCFQRVSLSYHRVANAHCCLDIADRVA
jgi:hypothetical protein